MAKSLSHAAHLPVRADFPKEKLKHVAPEVRKFGEGVLASCDDFQSTNEVMLADNRRLMARDRTARQKPAADSPEDAITKFVSPPRNKK